MRMDAAVARIQELSEIVFDPRIVAAFKEAWAAGELKGDPAASVAPAAPTVVASHHADGTHSS